MKRYKQTLAAFVDGAREFCSRRGMIYLLANNQCRSISWFGAICANEGWCDDVAIVEHAYRLAMGLLAAVPPAIVLLYFLKLKRQPLEVPSTYLWHKSIEDLHVNSIWQRLRQSLLLLLQLLLIAAGAWRLCAAGLAGHASSSATGSSSWSTTRPA